MGFEADETGPPGLHARLGRSLRKDEGSAPRLGGRRLPAMELSDGERAELKALTSRRKIGQGAALRLNLGSFAGSNFTMRVQYAGSSWKGHTT